MSADLLQDAQRVAFPGFESHGPFYRLVSSDSADRYIYIADTRHTDDGGRLPRAVLAGFAHGAMEAACRSNGESPTIVSLSCDFAADAQAGDRIEAQIRITRRTRSVIFLSADLTANGRVLLTANGLAKPAA
ncbi:MAG: thioesterase family protein [Alphaproteobacteria bacterium]|nr:thioesterase family protein [Alphaproteobacteria bacterium]MDE1938699.1 thioesterase family protein [Alphaproteobacteria bacterium]MDE2110445.1 thioesterase family protein [Alphaproteobacteria bacterium]MDE2493396.1 thioesterase family protein [Alphaproteobacteria bacterium]